MLHRIQTFHTMKSCWSLILYPHDCDCDSAGSFMQILGFNVCFTVSLATFVEAPQHRYDTLDDWTCSVVRYMRESINSRSLIKVKGFLNLRNGEKLSIANLLLVLKLVWIISQKIDYFRTSFVSLSMQIFFWAVTSQTFDFRKKNRDVYLEIQPYQICSCWKSSADSTGSNDLCFIGIDDKDRFSSLLCRTFTIVE